MTLARALLLVLVALNLLLFLVGQFRGAGGQPERLEAQLNADRISIVEVTPREPAQGAGALAVAPADAGQASAAGSRPEAGLPLSSERPAAAAPAASEPVVCRRYASLARERAARLLELAAGAGVKAAPRPAEPGSFWVHVPPQPNRQELEHRIAELKEAGVSDYFVVQDAGPNQNAISLGLFKQERMALDMRDKLRAKGLPQVRVQARESPGARSGVELRGPVAALAALAAEAGLGEARPQPCE